MLFGLFILMYCFLIGKIYFKEIRWLINELLYLFKKLIYDLFGCM